MEDFEIDEGGSLADELGDLLSLSARHIVRTEDPRISWSGFKHLRRNLPRSFWRSYPMMQFSSADF
jgi:hypothetical protein